MNEILSYIKTGAVGLVMGVFGSIIGFFPFMFLRDQLIDFFVWKTYGSYSKTPDFLLYLIGGLPLPFDLIIILPIGGALFGIIGAIIGLLRHSTRVWLWAGVAGLLFNFLVSFWSQ